MVATYLFSNCPFWIANTVLTRAKVRTMHNLFSLIVEFNL